VFICKVCDNRGETLIPYATSQWTNYFMCCHIIGSKYDIAAKADIHTGHQIVSLVFPLSHSSGSQMFPRTVLKNSVAFYACCRYCDSLHTLLLAVESASCAQDIQVRAGPPVMLWPQYTGDWLCVTTGHFLPEDSIREDVPKIMKENCRKTISATIIAFVDLRSLRVLGKEFK
jgi:hypothetical protein